MDLVIIDNPLTKYLAYSKYLNINGKTTGELTINGPEPSTALVKIVF